MTDNTIKLVKDLAFKSDVCKVILKDKTADNPFVLAGTYGNHISLLTQHDGGLFGYDHIYHDDIAKAEYSSGVLKLKDHETIQSIHFLKTSKMSKNDLN